jgi:putative oxidoreductase
MRTTDEALRTVNKSPAAGTSERLRFEARQRRGTDLGLLLLRLLAGPALAFAHGVNKLPPSDRFVAGVVEMGFPAPAFFAWAAGFAEFGGGLLLALGLLTRPAAFLILFTMCVAWFVRQAGDPFTEREAAMLYGGVALLYLVAGAGRFSLDALLDRHFPTLFRQRTNTAG